MGVVDDVERVQAWIVERGTSDQSAWFDSWAESFSAAVDAEDDDACEDLHIALIAVERLELRPSARLLTLDEVILSLGFDPAEFREG